MARQRRHLMANPHTEALIGGLLFCLASYLVWDAYDARNRFRSWPASMLP